MFSRSLREKCPNTELFLISGLYFPVSNPNTRKYGPQITPYLDTFHSVVLSDRPPYLVTLDNLFVLYSIPKWFHFHFFLYEKNIETTDISFSTNMSAGRGSSFTIYTYNQYLTRNLEMPVCYPNEYLTSPNLLLRGSNTSV